MDISATWEKKIEALMAFASQFRREEKDAAKTYIGSREFWEQIERRARQWGHDVGVQYGEAFMLDRPASSAHPLVQLTCCP